MGIAVHLCKPARSGGSGMAAARSEQQRDRKLKKQAAPSSFLIFFGLSLAPQQPLARLPGSRAFPIISSKLSEDRPCRISAEHYLDYFQ